MRLKRNSFQGVLNIIRFNCHFYVSACVIILVLLLLAGSIFESFQKLVLAGVLLALVVSSISLLVSFYVYDLSDLYQLNWVSSLERSKVLNINAGFDETSRLIKEKFPTIDLIICDFYDSTRHTELSIKRARLLYPPILETIPVSTSLLPFSNSTFDKSLAIFSAHEIRDRNERVQFFTELSRITKISGQILVTEHLRDFNNFLAYNIGFFHFYSRKDWLYTFKQANLVVAQEFKVTPFITIFILNKNGDSI